MADAESDPSLRGGSPLSKFWAVNIPSAFEPGGMTMGDLGDLPETCPGCGKALAEWTDAEGRGVRAGGLIYCSQECAERDQARS
jgi:hypothetical protein